MSEKRNKSALPKREKKPGTGGGAGQLLRMILYTSVAWDLVICQIYASFISRDEKLLRYIGIAAIFAVWVIFCSFAYEMLGAGRVLIFRLLFSLVFLFTFNVVVLVMIWAQKGPDSYLFKSGMLLTILSVVVYLSDLISFLVSVFGWKSSRKKRSGQMRSESDTQEPSAQADGGQSMRLPEGILRRVTILFLAAVIVGGVVLLRVMVRINLLTSNMPVLLALLALTTCICLVVLAVGCRIETWILSRDKYILHRLDDGGD